MAKTVTFYGTTYDQFDQQWPSAKSLTEVRDDANLFGFKFTLPMTKDGTDTDLETEENRRVDIPQLKLYMYDSNDTELKTYLEANGFTKTATDDREQFCKPMEGVTDIGKILEEIQVVFLNVQDHVHSREEGQETVGVLTCFGQKQI